MHTIRRTIYRVQDQFITLAFVPGIDGHPEVTDSTPPPESKPKADRGGPQMTEGFIRKVLGRPRRATAQQAQSELQRLRILRRVARQGF